MLGSGALVWVTIRLCKGLIASQQPIQLKMLEVVDKMTTIAASHDVQAYQGIQVMSQPAVGYPGDTYNPSDEAEAKREAESLGLNYEEMTDAEQEQLRGILA